MNISLVSLIVFLVHLASTEAGLAGMRNSYDIKRKPMASIPEALLMLKRFSNPLAGPRCEHYAVLLDAMSKSDLDQLKVADFAQVPTEKLNERLASIDRDSLRRLYIDALNSYLESRMELPALDVYDCLYKLFRETDAVARAFLNDRTLQDSVEQTRAILFQPARLLLDESYQHPTLRGDQLAPSVRRALLFLYNNNQSALDLHFPSGAKLYEAAARSGSVQPVGPVQSVPLERPAPVQAPLQAPAPVPAAAAARPPASVPARAQKPASIQAAPSQMPAQTPVTNPVQATVPGPAPEVPAPAQQQAPEEDLSSEDLDYLNRVGYLLVHLYSQLPVESHLGDRCEAYSRMVAAEHHEPAVAEQILAEVGRRVQTQGPSSTDYMPADAEVRRNYVLLLAALQPEQLNPVVYLDLLSCADKWQTNDAEVRELLASPVFTAAYHMAGMASASASASAPVSGQ